jgi:hypothetical protein
MTRNGILAPRKWASILAGQESTDKQKSSMDGSSRHAIDVIPLVIAAPRLEWLEG